MNVFLFRRNIWCKENKKEGKSLKSFGLILFESYIAKNTIRFCFQLLSKKPLPPLLLPLPNRWCWPLSSLKANHLFTTIDGNCNVRFNNWTTFYFQIILMVQLSLFITCCHGWIQTLRCTSVVFYFLLSNDKVQKKHRDKYKRLLGQQEPWGS